MKNNKAKPRKTAKKATQPFVYIVDSFPYGIYKILKDLGLKDSKNFYVTGAGGADTIMMGRVGRRFVDKKKLLVFMSSFHGLVEPAVKLAKEVKATNPKAKIVFRSMMVAPSDPVFEQCIEKDDEEFYKIVKHFLMKK